MQMYDDDLANLVPVDMEIEDMSLRKEMGRSIRNMYTGGAPFSKRLGTGIKVPLKMFSGFISDFVVF